MFALLFSGYDSDPDLESLWCGDVHKLPSDDRSTAADSGMSFLDDHPEGFSFLNRTSINKPAASSSLTTSTVSASNETAMFSLSSLQSGVFILNTTSVACGSSTPTSIRTRQRLEMSPGMDSGIEVAPRPAAAFASSTPNSKVRMTDWPVQSPGHRHTDSRSGSAQVKRKSSQPIGNEQKVRPSLQLE